MTEQRKTKLDSASEAIRRRTEQMQKTRNEPKYSPLNGLGVFGVIGWSVAIPTVTGALLGGWLNEVAPQSFSWPIALILGGVVVGAMVAWNWIDKSRDK